MKKKVTLINYTGRHGGGPIDAYEMAKALCENGETVVAVVSSYAENIEQWRKLGLEALVEVKTYVDKKTFIAQTLYFYFVGKYKIRKELEKYEIRNIYCPMVTFWTEAINSLYKKAKKIVVNHDPIPHSGDRIAQVERWFGYETTVYRRADIIIVHSQKYIQYVEKKFRKHGKVFYFPLGRHDFYKRMDKKEKTVEYSKDKVNFLFFGTISPYKGIEVLIKAYKSLLKIDKNISLTIAGKGDFSPYSKLCMDVENINIINRWIRDEEVESFFDGENVITVVPYIDATQSGVLLTAMDFGTPVIATKTGGIVEQIKDGINGILIEPNNVEALTRAMEQLAKDEELRKRLVDNSFKYLEEISWDSLGKRLIEIMESI